MSSNVSVVGKTYQGLHWEGISPKDLDNLAEIITRLGRVHPTVTFSELAAELRREADIVRTSFIGADSEK